MDENKITKILLEYKNSSNKDLLETMDFLQNDFEETKKNIIKLTHHLDSSEIIYNKILNEYKKRTK
jgi:site-specific DNA-adenine methylase